MSTARERSTETSTSGLAPRHLADDPAVHPDIICLSHLRWSFVFQRPHHLMTRFARDRRVFFVEEPVEGIGAARLDLRRDPSGVLIVVPHIPADLPPGETAAVLKGLVRRLLREHGSGAYVSWYLTPMALAFGRDLDPIVTVFDCMDELSAFALAPAGLRSLESELLARADIVFTGGRSLHEAKRGRHPNVYCHPSSVDTAHFAQARMDPAEPNDQQGISHPRLGYAGVIDERMDLGLIAGIAVRRPDWQIVLLGPVAKIDPASIPRTSNVHLLGAKTYAELPAYLAHWEVAMLPFARNDATRFISPTKTPEYLAAGRPVVSTSIADVVTPYGELGLVGIADDPEGFIAAADAARQVERASWLIRVDGYLAGRSWESTFAAMRSRLDALAIRRLEGVRRLGEGDGERIPPGSLLGPMASSPRAQL